jgi:ribose transport system ATP-binding protein
MVEIGKALSVNADIIVMDEPSAVVSGKELEALFRIIRSLKASNKTIIYISHRIDEIFQISDRTTVLKDGKVVGTVATASVDRPTIVRMMVGRSFAEVFPQKGTQISKDDLLVLNSVTRANILKNISFRVHRGEILGIAGLLGAGRTELARAIFGADPFDKGEISMRGIRIKQRRPRTSIAEGIGFVTENRAQDGLVHSLSVKENITLAILDKVKRWFVILDQKEKQIGSAAIKQFNIIVSSIQQEVKYLSGGNQQKVILARWINIAPDLLILDEPTRGIDVGAKAEIYLLMRRLSDRGVAIMMISSELPEIIGMSDRIIVMHDGAIMGELFSAEATEEKILMLATGQAGKTGQGGG